MDDEEKLEILERKINLIKSNLEVLEKLKSLIEIMRKVRNNNVYNSLVRISNSIYQDLETINGLDLLVEEELIGENAFELIESNN